MNNQLDFFHAKTNYSFDTSLPALTENKSEKQQAKQRVYDAICNGANCLLKIHEVLKMPQSSVSGRVNELIEEGKVYYSDKENYIQYKNKLRKRIMLVS